MVGVFSELKILRNSDMVPREWRNGGEFWVFTPSIIKRHDGGYTVCYRVVNAAGRRMIACAVFDSDFELLPGSVVPLSDLLKFPTNAEYGRHTKEWQADPRLFELNDGLYVSWNDGIPSNGHNHQFRLKLDPTSLLPISHVQELRITEPRRQHEKNWMFFEANGLKVVYSTNPFRVLAAISEDDSTITFSNFSKKFWNSAFYERRFGEIRGGAPPVKLGNYFYSISHSAYNTPKGIRYAASVIKFTAGAPFHVIAASKEPLTLPNPFGSLRQQAKLDPRIIDFTVYPTGAIADGLEWIIGYSINDESCAIARIPHQMIEDSLFPVRQHGPIMALVNRMQIYLASRVNRIRESLARKLDTLRPL